MAIAITTDLGVDGLPGGIFSFLPKETIGALIKLKVGNRVFVDKYKVDDRVLVDKFKVGDRSFVDS